MDWNRLGSPTVASPHSTLRDLNRQKHYEIVWFLATTLGYLWSVTVAVIENRANDPKMCGTEGGR
jgi:hypothetical protein